VCVCVCVCQELNRKLWKACEEGDAHLANDLLHQGAQVSFAPKIGLFCSYNRSLLLL
jgi:hypothetical protein